MLGISNQTQCRFDLSYFKEKDPSSFIWQLHVFIKEFISLHSNRTKTRWTDGPWLPSASNISHLLAFFAPKIANARSLKSYFHWNPTVDYNSHCIKPIGRRTRLFNLKNLLLVYFTSTETAVFPSCFQRLWPVTGRNTVSPSW